MSVTFSTHVPEKKYLKNHHILGVTHPGNMMNALIRGTVVFLVMFKREVNSGINKYDFLFYC